MSKKNKPKPWQDLWTRGAKVGGGGQGSAHHATSKADSAIVGVLKELHNNKKEQARLRMYREVVALETLAKAGLKVPGIIEHNTEYYEDLDVLLRNGLDPWKGFERRNESAWSTIPRQSGRPLP